MNKTIIIVIVSLALLVGAGFLLAYFIGPAPSSEKTATPGTVSLPVSQNTVIPAEIPKGISQSPVFDLSSADGGVLKVKNFLVSPDTYRDPINTGYYSLGYPINPAVESSSTPPFLVMYISETQFFTIELLQEPIGEARTQVELYLEQHLGLTPNDLCKLNYTLSVPVSVNQDYAGKNLGFSFCPGATVLPK